MKGMIALDIDGTLTADAEHLPKNVVDYLNHLVREEWTLFFVTGRPYRWAYRTLQELTFPYYFGVQNGAILLEMPSKKVIGKKYIPRSICGEMQKICCDEPSDFVIYSGYENHDLCYFRPQKFSAKLLLYLRERTKFLKEEWIPLDSFEQLPLDAFPSLKCFGRYEDVIRVRTRIESRVQLHLPIVRDPFDVSHCVMQGTHSNADKGQALKELLRLTNDTKQVIAAGDDLNDFTLFQAADIKIAMATAPQELLEIADIIAPAASEEGIIKGLQTAIYRLGHL